MAFLIYIIPSTLLLSCLLFLKVKPELTSEYWDIHKLIKFLKVRVALLKSTYWKGPSGTSREIPSTSNHEKTTSRFEHFLYYNPFHSRHYYSS